MDVAATTIDKWIQRRRLFPLYRAVYAVGHEAVGLRGRELAAVFAAGDDALLSHQSAGGLCRVRPPWQGTIHVIAHRNSRRDGLIIHRARSLLDEDRTVRSGIPCTSPSRTLIDLAEVLPTGDLLDALSEAVRLELIADLVPALERNAGHRGAAALQELVDDLQPTRSRLEREFNRVVDAYDLPRPAINSRVNGYEVDAHWPAHGLVVEVDGFEFHGTLAAFERDRGRDAELQAEGWRVVRITFLMLRREPARVAARIRRVLALQPASPSPWGRRLASISPGVRPA
jgi:very-short-patch-repair endonuclease